MIINTYNPETMIGRFVGTHRPTQLADTWNDDQNKALTGQITLSVEARIHPSGMKE